MSKLNINPYDTITGLDGLPLDQGYIYIGVVNLDPATNPQTAYWDAALTMPVNQPIRTVNGRVWNAGSPALIYAANNYSLRVLDKNQVQVLLALNVLQPVDNPVPISQGGTGATTAAQALINLGIITAIIQQTYTGYTTAGISTAYTLTPAPAIAASPMFTRFNVRFHVNGTGTPNLSISRLAAKLLKQYDGTGAKVTAVIKANQITDVIDDGTDYVLVDPIPPATSTGTGAIVKRNCAQFGARDTTGNAAFLTAGAALNFNVLASAVALTLGFAGGQGPTGNVDLPCVISADAANQGALAANSTNYIYADYTSAFSVSWVNRLAPWQDGKVYDRTRQAVLNFNGAAGSTSFIDDFGNTWAAQGAAKLQTNSFKYGSAALGGGGALNSTVAGVDYIKSTNFTSFGNGGWAIRCWVNPSTLPGAAVRGTIMGVVNAAGFGAAFMIYNNAGTIKFAYELSSTGTSTNIAANVQGTTTPVIGTYYFVELTYDALAGVYRLYVNGVQEASTASALRVCATTQAGVGFVPAYVAGLNGYFDKPEILPYCEHPGGTAYVPPAAAPSINNAGYASDWYDYNAGVLRTISGPSIVAGTDPTFSQGNRVYLGECDTNGANVTATRVYAYLREYDSEWFALPAAATLTSRNSNVGTDLVKAQVLVKNITAEGNFTPGDVVSAISSTTSGVAVSTINTRTTTAFATGSAGTAANNKTTGAVFTLTPASWLAKVISEGEY